MIMSALQYIAVKYFGGELCPGAAMMDHTPAFRIGYTKIFMHTPLGQCYPHLARKVREGKDYISKTNEHAEEAQEHVRRIHLAHSTEQRDLIMEICGKVCLHCKIRMTHAYSSLCRMHIAACIAGVGQVEQGNGQILGLELPRSVEVLECW